MSKSEASAFSQFEDHWMNDTVKARPFTIDELRAYLVESFPEFWKDGDFRVEDIAPMSATVRLIHHPRRLRPGGTISGPAMFAVCDVALFVAIVGETGRGGQRARRHVAVPAGAPLTCPRHGRAADPDGQATLIKLGKRLAVGEVALY